jgi:hypothetical protein
VDSPVQAPAAARAIEEIGSEEKLEDIIKLLAMLMARISIKEVERAFSDKNIEAVPEKQILPYLAAVQTLSFTGKGIDTEGIVKLLKSVAIVPESEYLNYIIGVKFKNSLVYASAIYFLVALGIEPTIEQLLNVIKALDMHPDASLAGYSITMYRLYKDEKF